jgi:hypothetical protein
MEGVEGKVKVSEFHERVVERIDDWDCLVPH